MKKLGFGLMRLPKIEENNPESIDQQLVNRMVDYYLEAGFTYFDTAYVYHRGMSEVAFRRALVERYPRSAFSIADKMPTWSITGTDDFQRIFDEQLQRCGVEFFDYYMLHNLGANNYANMLRYGGFEFMQKIKAGSAAFERYRTGHYSKGNRHHQQQHCYPLYCL